MPIPAGNPNALRTYEKNAPASSTYGVSAVNPTAKNSSITVDDECRREACAITRGETERHHAADHAEWRRRGDDHENDRRHAEVALQLAYRCRWLRPQSLWGGGGFGHG